jgi:phage-related protein
MKYQQRVRHMKVMWFKTFIKAKAGLQVLLWTTEIVKKI